VSSGIPRFCNVLSISVFNISDLTVSVQTSSTKALRHMDVNAFVASSAVIPKIPRRMAITLLNGKSHVYMACSAHPDAPTPVME
jgi:hypothetical protein